MGLCMASAPEDGIHDMCNPMVLISQCSRVDLADKFQLGRQARLKSDRRKRVGGMVNPLEVMSGHRGIQLGVSCEKVKPGRALQHARLEQGIGDNDPASSRVAQTLCDEGFTAGLFVV
jgi:hypothetical protein